MFFIQNPFTRTSWTRDTKWFQGIGYKNLIYLLNEVLDKLKEENEEMKLALYYQPGSDCEKECKKHFYELIHMNVDEQWATITALTK